MAISTTELNVVAAGTTVDSTVRASRRHFRFIANTKAAIGLTVLVIYLIFAVIGPWIAPYDPSARSEALLQGPSAKHWFGTTHLGQDIFSQVIAGTRPIMFVGLVAGVISNPTRA